MSTDPGGVAAAAGSSGAAGSTVLRARSLSADSLLPPSRSLLVFGLPCGLAGVAAWAVYAWVLRSDLGQDWMVFYTAARAFLDGNLPLIFDDRRFMAALDARFADWLTTPLILHPWVYPPSFLLLFLPFGALPPVVSLISFQVTSFAAAAVALCTFAGRGLRPMLTVSLLLCPAVPNNVMTGQNGFLTGGLLLGGCGLLTRAPLLAGALLGIGTFKPQLSLMVPVALVAGRHWRAAASAGGAAGLMALASLAVFGPACWHYSLGLATGQSPAYFHWLAVGRLFGQSVFACAIVLGASITVANLAQAAAVTVAACCVYRAFRCPAPPEWKTAVLLAATLLAAPHVSASDAVLLGPAIGLFLAALPPSGPKIYYAASATALWLSPLFNPPVIHRVGLVTPLLILFFLGCVLDAMRRAGMSEATPLASRYGGRRRTDVRSARTAMDGL